MGTETNEDIGKAVARALNQLNKKGDQTSKSGDIETVGTSLFSGNEDWRKVVANGSVISLLLAAIIGLIAVIKDLNATNRETTDRLIEALQDVSESQGSFESEMRLMRAEIKELKR